MNDAIVEISVNGVPIPASAIAAEAQNHPSASWADSQRSAAMALVVRELLLQEADRESVAPLPFADGDGRRETDDEARIRALVRDAVSVPDPDEASMRRFYDNNRARFRSPDLFEAAHILYVAPPDDETAIDRAKARAEATIARLQSTPALFAELARTESACSSAANGGNLGQVSRGQTVPEFETFLCNLEPGQLCPVPVRTRYGYHVLRLDRRVDGEQLPFEAVRDRIAAYLSQSVWQRAVAQYIRILAGRAEIVGLELPRSDGPLVQ